MFQNRPYRKRPYWKLLNSREFREMGPGERADFLALERQIQTTEADSRNAARLAQLEFRVREAELNQTLKLRSRELRVKTIEVYFRTLITAILVLILAAAIFVGILKKIPAQDMAEYLAPISGLAGIAIGYFFGRAVDKGDTGADESDGGGS
jgi:hypothetical protein